MSSTSLEMGSIRDSNAAGKGISDPVINIDRLKHTASRIYCKGCALSELSI